MARFATTVLYLSATYVLFVGQVSADEIGLAVLFAIVAAAWWTALAHVGEVRFRFEAAAGLAIARALAGVPTAVASVAARLLVGMVRQPRAQAVRQTFVHGSDRDPFDAARRAIALLAVSLAPDRFALRLLDGHDELLLHRLVETGGPSDARWAV